MYQPWNDPPIGILHLILDPSFYFGYENTISQCTLVCKSWNIVATHRLYTNVEISVSELPKFIDTISENKNLASLVKKVDLEVFKDSEGPSQKDLIYILLSKLPNLQHFYAPPCLASVTKILRRRKLRHLRTLGDPMDLEFSHEYIDCALLMGDRLQDLLLSGEGLLYHRLYNRLDQFRRLEEIYVHKSSTNPIEDIDSIVEKCASLQKLHAQFDIVNSVDDSLITNIHEEIMPLIYTPRPEVHLLSIILYENKVHQILLKYIMYKFPNLKSLHLHMEDADVIDSSTYTRLVAYLSKMESLYVHGINTSIERICDDVGSYWEATQTQTSHRLVSLCIEPELMRSEASLSFGSESNTRDTTIRLPFSHHSFRDTGLLQKYGKHVGALEIRRSSKSLKIIKNLFILIASSLTNCGKLIELTFYDCYMPQIKSTMLWKAEYLQQVTFRSCKIHRNVIGEIFGGVNHVNSLTLEECKFIEEECKLEAVFVNIDLPNTAIGSMFFKDHSDSYYQPGYMLFLISTIAGGSSERVENYYRCNFPSYNDGFLEPISESEYYDAMFSLFLHMKICCRSINSLEVEHNNCTSSLPTTNK